MKSLFRFARAVSASGALVFLPAITQAECRDSEGAIVPYLRSDAIPKQGLSTWTPQGPVIYLRSDAYGLPRPVFEVLLEHECGHHALGHVRAALQGAFIGPQEELDADIYGFIHAIQKGALHNRQEVDSVLQFISQLPPDPTNYTGWQRARAIDQALRDQGY